MSIKGLHSTLPIMGFGYLGSASIRRLPEDFGEKRNDIIKRNLEAITENFKCFNDIVFSAGIKQNTEEEVLENIEKHRKNMI